MWAILGAFFVEVVLKSLRFIAGLIGDKAVAWARLISYLGLCYTSYYALITAVNFIIRQISVVNKIDVITVAFSYLPLNIQDCFNIILHVQFISYIYLYKDRVYRLIYDLFKSNGLSVGK
ncbi:TPA: hypothetical protein M2P76_004381 [Escherichia coli]|uniref:hypothetical protein n=1 Tax=Escherichia coli TaxID=562 RepID=UPI0007A01B3E|nr:hypothetical protein [Escherichia coli]EFA4129986.1 hypothetical protein [Escherichia coli O13]EEQ6526463.1 hypothetical protein [Escherichia coli]EFJ5687708.1 hypothetical protein [Escherichia coli]EFK3242697.1 hypothetical protein [Escherichia coli]EIV8321845.1 hypothetical protein [Escherichia coli]